MVITPVFETGIQGSIPCKNIWEYGNTDSGRKVKAPDLSSGATQPFNGKPVENYERNWDAFSGSMWNIELNIGWGIVACWVRFPPIRNLS